jgi:putative membrane protein (TIGR04086 family)
MGVKRMDFDREESLIPVGTLIYGSLAAFLMVLILTTCLAVLTELGWTGTITWPNHSLYLLLLFAAVIVGSLLAGWRSREKGWAVGIGVGVISSLVWLILALFLHERIQFGVFLIKTLLSTFIATFGGIIGVNLFGNRG